MRFRWFFNTCDSLSNFVVVFSKTLVLFLAGYRKPFPVIKSPAGSKASGKFFLAFRFLQKAVDSNVRFLKEVVTLYKVRKG